MGGNGQDGAAQKARQAYDDGLNQNSIHTIGQFP
jgi:hypothetical protein